MDNHVNIAAQRVNFAFSVHGVPTGPGASPPAFAQAGPVAFPVLARSATYPSVTSPPRPTSRRRTTARALPSGRRISRSLCPIT